MIFGLTLCPQQWFPHWDLWITREQWGHGRLSMEIQYSAMFWSKKYSSKSLMTSKQSGPLSLKSCNGLLVWEVWKPLWVSIVWCFFSPLILKPPFGTSCFSFLKGLHKKLFLTILICRLRLILAIHPIVLKQWTSYVAWSTNNKIGA